MASGKTVAANDGTGELRPHERFIDFALLRVEEDKIKAGARAEALGNAQIDAILSAGDLDTMFAADDIDSTAAKDLEDVELCLLDVVYSSSDRFTGGISLGNGQTLFVFLTVKRLSDGDVQVINTGSRLIIAKARWLEANELLGTPDANVVFKGTDTASGGRVLKMYAVPKRAVQSTVES